MVIQRLIIMIPIQNKKYPITNNSKDYLMKKRSGVELIRVYIVLLEIMI